MTRVHTRTHTDGHTHCIREFKNFMAISQWFSQHRFQLSSQECNMSVRTWVMWSSGWRRCSKASREAPHCNGKSHVGNYTSQSCCHDNTVAMLPWVQGVASQRKVMAEPGEQRWRATRWGTSHWIGLDTICRLFFYGFWINRNLCLVLFNISLT